MSNEIVPGILEKSWNEVQQKIEVISKFSKTIHIDFIDGKFANNLTFLDPAPFSKYSKEIFFEAHLMVLEPQKYLASLAESGFKRFLGHIEKMSNQEEFVAQAQLLGEVGLAIDFQTSVDEIKVPLDDLDAILIMTVKTGFSNQEFQNSALDKVQNLRSKTTIPIEVDGGINDQTILLAKQAGANRFVSTNFICNADNPEEAYRRLVNAE